MLLVKVTDGLSSSPIIKTTLLYYWKLLGDLGPNNRALDHKIILYE